MPTALSVCPHLRHVSQSRAHSWLCWDDRTTLPLKSNTFFQPRVARWAFSAPLRLKSPQDTGWASSSCLSSLQHAQHMAGLTVLREDVGAQMWGVEGVTVLICALPSPGWAVGSSSPSSSVPWCPPDELLSVLPAVPPQAFTRWWATGNSSPQRLLSSPSAPFFSP